MNKIVYVSGKMSGEPNHGFEAFHNASKRLREAGYVVLSPAEIHHAGDDWNWHRYLWKDISILQHCTHIALLDNWSRSPGARLELAIACKMGLSVLDAQTLEPLKCSVDFNFEIHGEMAVSS